MLLVSLSHITKRFDEQVIIDRGSLTVTAGEKIGVVGRNGAGKTTLLNLIEGRLQPDSGSVDRRKELKIGVIEQELAVDKLELSLYDFCFLSHPRINDTRLQMARLEPVLHQDNPPPEIINEYHFLTQRYEELGGYRLETEVRLVLEGIGFTRAQINRELGSISGGERNRAQIAAILVGDYDLLLLDEPTNHLDINSTIWLENYIGGSRQACLIISHDRRFLQNATDKILQLSLSKLELFHCRYEQYLAEREKRQELAMSQYQRQAEEIARIEDFIRRNIAGQKTRQAQSRQKYLARLKKADRPRLEGTQAAFQIKDGGRSFRDVLRVEDLTVGHDNIPVVEEIQFELTRGSRVGLVGPNGCGKTTLLKTLGGYLEPISGEITVGKNVELTYFDQELSNIDPDKDVISELWEVDPLAESGRLRSFLARFGFTGEDVFKPVSLLSGGEKTKLSLAKILYRPANLMIFDEPTNHLDIVSIEALEEGLANYNGTLLVVSHDRDFLDKVVNQVFDIKEGQLRCYLGNYSEYAERCRQMTDTKKEISRDKKRSYELFREESRRKSRHRKRLMQIGEEIKLLESEWKELERQELTVDKSDWKRLSAIREDLKVLEDKILSLYIEKETTEARSPDEQQ